MLLGSRPLEEGELVRTGETFHPYYRIIAVRDERAWIREVQHGSDHVVPLDRCQRVAPPVSAAGRELESTHLKGRTAHELPAAAARR